MVRTRPAAAGRGAGTSPGKKHLSGRVVQRQRERACGPRSAEQRDRTARGERNCHGGAKPGRGPRPLGRRGSPGSVQLTLATRGDQTVTRSRPARFEAYSASSVARNSSSQS
jgi:hypothetical protein